MAVTSTIGDLRVLRQEARELKDKIREAKRDADAAYMNSDSPMNGDVARHLSQALIDLRNAEYELDLALDRR